jgi:hypothetical protein
MARPSLPLDLMILIMFSDSTNNEVPNYEILSIPMSLPLSLASKYSAQPPVLKHSQSVFFTQ